MSGAPEPTLADVLHDLGRAKVHLLLGFIFGLLCGFAFLWAAVPQYRASLLVSPATRSGAPDISGLFPGNASFAMEYVMQSFAPGDSSDFMRFESILREPTVAKILLDDPAVRKGLSNARRHRFALAPPPDTPEKLAEWLQDNIRVEPAGATRLRRVTVLHPDPAFAVFLLQALYKTADGLIRAELAGKTENRIGYLREAIGRTDHPEHRRVLTDLLMDQEQISTIMAVGEPFSAMIAEPPYATAKPYWPRRPFVLAGFAFAGLVLGYALYGLRKSRDAR